MDKIWTFNNNIMKYGNSAMVTGSAEPPGPPLPSDMHFLYLANDYNGTYIQNRAINSGIGSYQRQGSLTKYGNGSNCYISADGWDDMLCVSLDNNDLELMKGLNNVYTFFIRVYNNAGDYDNPGGIISWRYQGDGYIYMIRSSGNQLQIHLNGGIDTGLLLTADTVYKIAVSLSFFGAYDLYGPHMWSTTGGPYERDMGNIMTTFNEGSGYSPYMERFYGIAGIARVTTREEDMAIASVLMNQTV